MRAIFLVLLSLAISRSSEALTRDVADVRIAVVVGNNVGHRRNRTLRFAERDACKMYRTLIKLGGFSETHSTLVLGKSASDIRRALQRAEQYAARLHKELNKRALLVFYYSGHADGDALELGKSELSFSELKAFLRKSKAAVRVAVVDSCQSGRLVMLKGGRRAGPYQIRVADQIESSGYAVITSSAADELSQESEDVRGSYFTHYFVSALHGAADHSGDGFVTLTEAYRFVYAKTLTRTSSTFSGTQHPMYDFRLSGRGDIVLASAKRGNRLTVSSKKRARLIVLQESGDTVVAEDWIRPGRTVALALPRGAYRVFLVENRSAWSAPVRFGVGETHVRLVDSSFSRETLKRSVAKGGLFSPTWSHQLGVGIITRTSPVFAETATLGGVVVYRAIHHSGWQPTLRLTSTSAALFGEKTGYVDVGALGGIGYGVSLWGVTPYIEILAGYEHLFQSPSEGSRHSASFTHQIGGGVTFGVSEKIALSVAVSLDGRLLKLRDGGATYRVGGQGLLSVAWSWASDG